MSDEPTTNNKDDEELEATWEELGGAKGLFRTIALFLSFTLIPLGIINAAIILSDGNPPTWTVATAFLSAAVIALLGYLLTSDKSVSIFYLVLCFLLQKFIIVDISYNYVQSQRVENQSVGDMILVDEKRRFGDAYNGSAQTSFSWYKVTNVAESGITYMESSSTYSFDSAMKLYANEQVKYMNEPVTYAPDLFRTEYDENSSVMVVRKHEAIKESSDN
ncbi:hypothetical protein BOW16_12300 [Solemya velum gill symbiont]|uniref:hypothetical protein n=1 Tax=Solemya velum gill symbiont TaxID=2340 RepID=UPI000997021F|nr:hypothetical protein [Solemya velum gill symbiont]OOY88941.1 hypothetical protein BOW16_12300 [Solemya velum gill symbiont]